MKHVCENTTCRRVFETSRKGRGNWRYCSDPCWAEQRERSNRERQRRWRERHPDLSKLAKRETRVKRAIKDANEAFIEGRCTRRERDARLLAARQKLSAIVHQDWRKARGDK